MPSAKRIGSLALLACLVASRLPGIAHGLPIEPDAVFVRVVDTGPGLATITRLPGGYAMIYDTGHWNQQQLVKTRFEEVLPAGSTVDLLVLSHNDADHISATDEVFDLYNVKRVLWLGLDREPGANLVAAQEAIRDATASGTTTEINLSRAEFPQGGTYRLGESFVSFVSGFNPVPAGWDIINQSERRNAGSIVIRVQFAGRAILFAGDLIGRHIGDPPDTTLAGEDEVLRNVPVVPIWADVLIAPHHGADNGSSTAFIEAVHPSWVIFSAGHEHAHPRAATAERYLTEGVSEARILRTDLGDDEGVSEWSAGRVLHLTDGVGDDDVEILLRPTGEVLVAYNASH